jgi:hypothetical protein
MAKSATAMGQLLMIARELIASNEKELSRGERERAWLRVEGF